MNALGPKPQATLTRREWQEFRIGAGGLTEARSERVHALAVQGARSLRLPETAVLTRTHKALKAQQITGIISIPGLTLEILPKIDGDDGAVRAALVRMLAVAYNLRVSEGEISTLNTQHHDLLELLIRLFCERLLIAIKHGLPRRYLELTDDLKFLRGRLDVKRQLTTHASRPDRLACRFDELSENTPLNRVLKVAVHRLRRISRAAENLRRLDELSSRLEMAENSPNPLAEPVQLDRTNTAFHSVYELARLFLSGDWQTTTGGHAAGFALLFAMNDLFEAYVGRKLKSALAPLSVRLQDRRHHALQGPTGGAFALRPDAVIETDSGTIILDTKWKRLDRSLGENLGVSQSDVYQMMAYAHAYDAKRLLLIYPWHYELGAPGVHQSWRISGSDRVLEAASVDVGRTKDFSGQLAQLFESQCARRHAEV